MTDNYQRLGDLLVSEKRISNLQLSIALAAQKTTKKRLGEILVDRGFATEQQIANSLAKQYAFDIVDLKSIRPEPAALALIPADLALLSEILPIAIENGTLRCAISDPLDIHTTDRISNQIGMMLTLGVAPRTDLVTAIRTWYSLDSVDKDASSLLGLPKPPKRFTDLRFPQSVNGSYLTKARDTALDRDVSLLTIPNLGTDSDKHLSIIQSVAKQNGPGICSVHDWFETSGAGWAVLEPLDGETLSNILNTRGPRTPSQASEIISQIAAGIDSVSMNSPTHGLICPENVFVMSDGRTVIAPLTVSPNPYLAPEIFEGEKPTAASDVYSLGALLYATISGNAATENPTFDSNRFPKAMESLISKSMRREPGTRLDSAFHFQLALASCAWTTEQPRTTVTTNKSENEDREILLFSVVEANESLPEAQSFWSKLFGKKAA